MMRLLAFYVYITLFGVVSHADAAVVTLTGRAYLSDSADHAGITVLFERIAPTALADSTLTSSNGQFSASVESGIYNVTFRKDGYLRETLQEQPYYANTVLDNVTLRIKKTLIGVPDDFPTIQSAINSAVHGDTVLVSSGTWQETISFDGKNIVVASHFLTTGDERHIAETVIDGGGNGSVVTFSGGESVSAVLYGLTVTNGDAASGGGILCNHASPTLKHIRITGNTAQSGGGMYAAYSGVVVENTIIAANTASVGGGVYFDHCGPASGSTAPALVNVTISNNSGDGVYHANSAASIKNGIVANNTGAGITQALGDIPGLIYSVVGANTGGDFINCGAWLGKNITVNANGDSCDAYYNVQADPHFADTASGDYRLLNTSLCIGAGTSENAPLTDINGVTRGTPPDAGAYENALDKPMHIPVFQTTSVPNATEGVYYSYTLKVIDPDVDDVLTYALIEAPSWMSLSSTGRLYGTPGEYDPALNVPLTVTVTDMYDLSDTLSTTFDVIDVNSPPHILTVSLRDARETRAYADTVRFRDADTNDTHTFTLLRSPSWMTVDSNGILGGTPGLFDSGVNIPVHVAVTDAGGLSDTLRVTINVADVTNQYASFSIDTDLEHAGCQEDSVLYNPGPGNEFGFAVYLRAVDEVRSFRLRITWNPSVVSFVHSRSGSSITGGDYDINGEENVPVAGEKNALVVSGGFLSSLIEENDPGVYTVVTAKMGGEAFRGPDGLLYFIVFRTRDDVPVTESFSINIELDIIDDKGIINTLDPRNFIVGEYQGLFPPSRLVVQDVMNDHGHLLQLTWVPSPHEISGRVNWYRIYRSRTPSMGDVRPLLSFMTVDELVAWEGHSVVLVDSVSAGFHGFVDKFVPLLNVPYYYWLQAVGTGIASSKISSQVSTAVAEAPIEFNVGHPWPNPFNPVTSLEFTLPYDMRVRLRVVNLAGQNVAVLCDDVFGPGRHTAQWDAAGEPSGIYFLVVDAGSRRVSRKVLLLK